MKNRSSFRLFRNLHRRRLNRWQVERILQRKPRYMPWFLWIRIVTWIVTKMLSEN